MAKYKNPIKESLRENLKNEIIKTNVNFDELWKNSMKLAVGFIGGKRNRFGQKYSEVARYLVREKILEPRFKQKSFYSRFEEAEGTFREKFITAQKEEYFERTEAFREKYGDEKIEYLEVEKTINEWFEMFNENIISEEFLNEVLKEFQRLNKEYLKHDYNGIAQNESTNADDIITRLE